MKRMAVLAAIFGIAVALSSVSWAEKGDGKGKKGGPGPIQQADTNKDGKVTFEELKAARPKMTEERFKQLDTNKDGLLDKADHAQGKPGQHGAAGFLAMLSQADANKDEKVTLDELKAVRPKMTEERFKTLDQDQDGVLTKADAPKGPVKAEAKPGNGHGGKLKEADVNNDGKVTFEELKAVNSELTEEKFKKLDRDGDGAITPADRKQDK